MEVFGTTSLVEKIRTLILDSDFQKFEEDNPGVSVFEELLMVKRRKFEASPLGLE